MLWIYLTLIDFPANLSDLEEQWIAWCWRQHVVIKTGREWMPELWIWDPSLPPGELCGHCNLAVISQEHIGSFFCVLLAVTERSLSVSQFSRSVVSDALQLFAARQGSLSITNSQSLLKLMFIESVMPSNHLILCHPLLLLLQSSSASSLFQWVSSSHQVAKVLEFQLQHQSFQWTFRTDFL